LSPEVRIAQLARLRSSKDLVDRRLGEQLDIRRLAAHAGYSPFHFIRAFRAAYGETPAQYLRRRRIERARDLLGAANLTVGEVAELVGFTNLGAFSSRFKQQVGLPPSEYRRRTVARGGVPPVPGYVVLWARRHTAQERNFDETGALSKR
jgi:transcriptional regulator GlxA family with amidase domain